jgi:hypothetical protein
LDLGVPDVFSRILVPITGFPVVVSIASPRSAATSPRIVAKRAKQEREILNHPRNLELAQLTILISTPPSTPCILSRPAMPPISIDPTLSASEIANAHHIENPEDTDRLQLGDVVESWDFTFRWDEDCMPAAELEKWRQIPDPLVDEYLATLPTSLLSPKEDQLQILISQAQGSVSSVPSPISSSTSTSSSNSTPSESNLAARALLDHLTAAPPDGVRCSDETMRDAQECFYRFAGGLLLGTFYISLVGGFSS